MKFTIQTGQRDQPDKKEMIERADRRTIESEYVQNNPNMQWTASDVQDKLVGKGNDKVIIITPVKK